MAQLTASLSQKIILTKDKLAKFNTNLTGMFTEIFAHMATSRTKTIKVIVGAVGVAGCNFNFVTAANASKQNIDLGAIIPAFARIRDVVAVTSPAFVGAAITAFGVEAGSASAGAQHWVSADLIANNAIGQQAVGAAFTPLAIIATAQNVWISGTPTGGNWSALTAGKLTITITYTERT